MSEDMTKHRDSEMAEKKNVDNDDGGDMFDEIKDFLEGAIDGLNFIVKYVGFVLAMIMCVAIPIAMVVVGVTHKDNCPVERFIPIYLIAGGAVGTLLAGFASIYIALSKGRKRPDREKSSIKIAIAPFVLFLLAWFIAGNVWVFRVFKKHQNSDHEAVDYCHKGTFNFAATLIIGTYVGFVLLFGLFACLFARKKSK